MCEDCNKCEYKIYNNALHRALYLCAPAKIQLNVVRLADRYITEKPYLSEPRPTDDDFANTFELDTVKRLFKLEAGES